MSKESHDYSPENVENDPLVDARMLADVENGQWMDARVEPWLRAHASDPSVRLAAVRGILTNAGNAPSSGDARIREILGLTDDEFQTPAAKRQAVEFVSNKLANGDLQYLLGIERLARLGPDFFSAPSTLALLENAITALGGLNERIHVLPGLLALPVPSEFFQRSSVRQTAVGALTDAIYDGDASAIEMAHALGVDAIVFANPDVRDAVVASAEQCVEQGSYERFRQWADAFGIADDSVSVMAVLMGYRRFLQDGKLEEGLTFTRHFPQYTDAAAGRGNARAVILGMEKLILDGDLDAALRIADAGNLSAEVRKNTTGAAIQRLFLVGDAKTISRIKEGWNVLDSEFQDAAALAIQSIFSNTHPRGDAWETAVRAQQISGLSNDRLEKAIEAGQAQAVRWMIEEDDQEEDPYGNHSVFSVDVESIKRLSGDLPIRAEFATRLERANALTAIACLLDRGYARLADVVRAQVDGLDDATVRSAILEAARTRLLGSRDDNGNASYPMQYLNEWLATRNIPVLTWEDLRTEATYCATKALLEYDPGSFVRITQTSLQAPAAERDAILSATRDDVELGMLIDGVHETNREELFKIYGLSWKDYPLRRIPLAYLLATQDAELLERRKSDPWNDALAALLKAQGRSANEEHDPWITELCPLVDPLVRFGQVLDRESPDDGKLLVEYVKTFGMLNLPNVARVFFLMTRDPSAVLDEADMGLVVELVGRKAERMDGKQIINELRMRRFGFQRALLRDEIPPRLETTLGSEIFLALRGSTQWGREDDTAEVMAAWKKTVDAAKADPRTAGDVEVAPGYEEASFSVPRAYRSKDGSASAEGEIRRLLTTDAGTATDDGERGPRKTSVREEIEAYELTGRTVRVARRDGETADRTLADLERFHPSAPRDRAAFEALFRDRDDAGFVSGMERIATTSGAPGILRELSAIHIARMAPTQWADHLSKVSSGYTEAEVRYRAEFIAQYLTEHYLNPTQSRDHVGHAPFSETLRLALEAAWNVGGASENAILSTVARIDAIRAKQKRLSANTMGISLVPVHGPLRIYAGDIGDACYSSRHFELAEGKYPRLKALIFVTNRGKPTERMNGSVLFVETRMQESNDRVLAVRANNPRENLVADLDAPSLIRQTIDAAIATARRRKIKHVGVVQDGPSQASSNREAVSKFYYREYGFNMTARLANEPETNFNRYDIWNEKGEHPTAIVWTNDDPEAT